MMRDFELPKDYCWVSDSAIDFIKDKDEELRILRSKYIDLLEQYNAQQVNWVRLDTAVSTLLRNIDVSEYNYDLLSVGDRPFTEFLTVFMGERWVKDRIVELINRREC